MGLAAARDRNLNCGQPVPVRLDPCRPRETCGAVSAIPPSVQYPGYGIGMESIALKFIQDVRHRVCRWPWW